MVAAGGYQLSVNTGDGGGGRADGEAGVGTEGLEGKVGMEWGEESS